MDAAIIEFVLDGGNHDERVVRAAAELLDALGYKCVTSDGALLRCCVELAENHIKNFCHIAAVPDGLLSFAARRIVGEFLRMKNGMGMLNIETLDLSGAVTQIKEGDVSVSFGNGSSDIDKFNRLLNAFLNDGKGELICYRKLKW